jgi:rare lipoprotein A
MKHLRGSFVILCAVMLACLISACGTKKKVRAAKPPRIGSNETGIASWYGNPYHGRRAANGEIYDMEKFTAAHRTLPFGTWVRVKNLTNDKTVDVRIQDRGPFVGHRIIDLSHAAAREIELIGPGTARVRLTIITASSARIPKTAPASEPVVAAAAKIPAAKTPAAKTPEAKPPEVPSPADVKTAETKAAEPNVTEPPITQPQITEQQATQPQVTEPELFAVQIGAFQDQVRAEALRASMKDRYGAARIVIREAKPLIYRVLVGEEDSMEKATALAERMRMEGTSGFVVRLDVVRPAI